MMRARWILALGALGAAGCSKAADDAAPGPTAVTTPEPAPAAPSATEAATATATATAAPDASASASAVASADASARELARQAALRDAQEFGLIGLLNAGKGGDPDAPTAPWGRDSSIGTDPLEARGNMWGDQIGESFGSGGLGLAGVGEGGGGRGEGIGLGSVGVIGHGAGTGQGYGYGSGAGRGGTGSRATPPRVRMGTPSVSGRLPPEVVQRILRQHFGRLRLCYEQGLGRDPKLEGRVVVGFTIQRSGEASDLATGGDLPDAGVKSCVERALTGLHFPAPEAGVVKVSCPIAFSPGDAGPAATSPAPALSTATPGGTASAAAPAAPSPGSPTSARIAGKPAASVTARDLAEAFRAAGWSDVTTTTRGPVSVLELRRGDKTITLYFVPAFRPGALDALTEAERARLASEGAVWQEAGIYLGVVAGSPAEARALLRALMAS
ncbi:MAG: AgmX/PglI C-terminal domain-containing protein [Polyangiaceae bacterium]|nr:AgmX/PglI C-terminal domain-containing protein [Polyangiaceae bacterium]